MNDIQKILRSVVETREVIEMQIDQTIASTGGLEKDQKIQLGNSLKKVVHSQLQNLIDRSIQNL